MRLGGTIAVLLEKGGEKFETERLLPTKPEFGEIYSMTLDSGRLLTSHSRNVTTIQVRRTMGSPIKFFWNPWGLYLIHRDSRCVAKNYGLYSLRSVVGSSPGREC